MAIGIKNDAMQSKGSGYAAYAQCNSSGSATTAYAMLPRIKTSTLSDSTAQNVLEDEGGLQFSRDGARTVTWEATLMQTDADTLNIVETFRGNYYTIIKEMSNTAINAYYNYLCMPICKPVLEFAQTQPGGEFTIKFALEAVTATATISLTAAATASSAYFVKTLSGTEVVAPGKYWSIEEVAA